MFFIRLNELSINIFTKVLIFILKFSDESPD